MMGRYKKIVLLTTGQPSTNPRIMKEADALINAGYTVKILYSYWTAWATKTDNELLKQYPPSIFVEVAGNPITEKSNYFISKILYKIIVCLGGISSGFRNYSLSRSTFALAKAAKKEKADLFIAHNLGALPAAAQAAKKADVVYAFDAEDYHRGEYAPQSGIHYELTKITEDTFLPGCTYISAASPLIAQAYSKIVPASDIQVIYNVFSKKYLQQLKEIKKETLGIFWFSQTIGINRGLETIIEAINLLPQCSISLHLMGDCSAAYSDSLIKLSVSKAIEFLKPEQPDKIFSFAAKFEIGLASEVPYSDNRNFCLTNKLFTYLMAGNCIVASNTLAQTNFMNEHPGIGVLYDYKDVNSLALLLEKLYYDRAYIHECRKNALETANTKLNWETEQIQFIKLINRLLN